ncbi:MAG: hypothetical protein WAL85_17055, partial [Candidatus Korobacteraceae bacterium]
SPLSCGGTSLKGHDFSRADKPFIFVIPSGLQAARDLLSRFFSSLFSRALIPTTGIPMNSV